MKKMTNTNMDTTKGLHPSIKEAREKAKYLVGMVQGTMSLEGQGLPKEELKKMEDDTVKSILMRDREIEDLRDAARSVAFRLSMYLPLIKEQFHPNGGEIYGELADCLEYLEEVLGYKVLEDPEN